MVEVGFGGENECPCDFLVDVFLDLILFLNVVWVHLNLFVFWWE